MKKVLTGAEEHSFEEKGPGTPITLLDVLRSYDYILKKNIIPATLDAFYYKFLISLSQEPGSDWWLKLQRAQQVSTHFPFFF